MIHPSTFLSRALLADAIFSGVSAAGLTLGAGLLVELHKDEIPDLDEAVAVGFGRARRPAGVRPAA